MKNKKNLSSYAKIEEAYNRVQALQHVTAKLSNAFTIKHIAEIIVQEGMTVLGASTGEINVPSENSKGFDTIAWSGYSKELIEELNKVKAPLLTSYVIKVKRPFFIQDVRKIPKQYKIANLFITQTKTYSAAFLPLKTKNIAIGLLQFTFTKPQTFTQDDKEFMLTLAHQCSQAFEKVTAIENLKNSKEELEVIIKHIVDGITVQDRTGKLIYANQAAVSLNGYTSLDDMLSAPLLDYTKRFDIQDESGKPFPVEKLPGRRALAGEKDPVVTLRLVNKKTGESSWMKITSSVVHNAGGHPYQVVNVMHDMTQEKEVEQRKDDFISMASHELKTPLTTLKVFVQMLKKEFPNDTSNKLLDKIDIQLNKLSSLVNELLDITKMKQGKLQVNKEKFVLSELVKEIVESMQSITTHRIIIKDVSQIPVTADRDRVGQVIINFISNAIKYSPEGKRIIISITVKDKQCVFSVKDFGIGIPAKEQQKVFDRFYRAEEEDKTYPGLGLGLYISSEVIKQHGGRIWVTSKEGKGSTFFFSLPLK